MKAHVLNIPLPPSTNRMLAHSGRGVRRSKQYVSWLQNAGWEAKLQARGGMIVGEYDLTVKAVRPDKRKRDLDNLLKPISDLIVSVGLVEDDSLCRRIVAEWAPTGSPLQVIVFECKKGWLMSDLKKVLRGRFEQADDDGLYGEALSRIEQLETVLRLFSDPQNWERSFWTPDGDHPSKIACAALGETNV